MTKEMTLKRKKQMIIAAITLTIILFVIQFWIYVGSLHSAVKSHEQQKEVLEAMLETQNSIAEFDHDSLVKFINNYNKTASKFLSANISKNGMDNRLERYKPLTLAQALSEFNKSNNVTSCQYYQKAQLGVCFSLEKHTFFMHKELILYMLLDFFILVMVVVSIIMYGFTLIDKTMRSVYAPNKFPLQSLFFRKSSNQLKANIEELISERVMLLSTLFHDVKTPLTRTMLYLQVMPKETPFLEKLSSDLMEINEIIDSTVTYYQGNSGDQRVDVNKLIKRIAESSTQCSVMENPDEHLLVAGNEGLLYRALANICNNAEKYAGGCTIHCYQQDQHVVIEISDQGPGVPEAKIQSIFEPQVKNIHQAGNSTGYGLGLAIALKIIGFHKGKMTVKNTYPGLCFTIELPCA
ncbi:HAMP domain-containing sensor histidine kinase [Cysteiniphilum sp. QT6929]|uniref:sensor histidine kinase n=1 Tax=Cysteiniphilum sp. QT6929 TaxID=2975055 RepID=UPI0024B3566C|nr:HAMP domain-containing sensor histidine kinase [Cysteiniphilum sp. QT6929]WHN64691.1 HAMP domain-containing histidine kinase [Cysteiniphilum sp. QT6929]